MKTIGNLLWFACCGVWMALGWLVSAALLACTIIGIPFARQCVKIAHFALWPFGRTVVPSATAVRGGLIGNVIWFIFGVLLAIGYAITGIFLCITVIGIPFGVQAFKMIPLALAPFGKEIITNDELRTRTSAPLPAA